MAFSFLYTNNDSQVLDGPHSQSCKQQSHVLPLSHKYCGHASGERITCDSYLPTLESTRPSEEYVAIVSITLEHNATLKIRGLRHSITHLRLTDNEDKQVTALLKKNYALERLPDVNLKHYVGDASAILRLNGEECRYLVNDAASIWKGAEVFSAVSNAYSCT
jgi:hypothetical protein